VLPPALKVSGWALKNADVHGEKYPPVRVTPTLAALATVLSGDEATSAGRDGLMVKFCGSERSPFWLCTKMGICGDTVCGVHATGEINWADGMVARSSVALRNIVGTATPFASTLLLEEKFVPFKYMSCCTEPSCATAGMIEEIVA